MRYESLATLLSGIEAVHAEDELVLSRIVQTHADLKPLFSRLVETHRDTGFPQAALSLPPEVGRRLVSQLSMKAQTMVSHSFRLLDRTSRRLQFAQRQDGVLLMVVVVVIGILVLLIIILVSNRIVAGITTLQEGTQIIADGDLSHRVVVSGRDEIADLARAFNAMTLKLRASYGSLENQIAERLKAEASLKSLTQTLEQRVVARTGELQESERRFRQLAENINDVFWMVTPDGRNILYVSPAYEAIWGRRCDDLYKNAQDWIEAIHPDDRERVSRVFHEKAASGGYDEEFRIVLPDGRTRWILDRGFPVHDEHQQVYRIAGIAEDITERRRAEEQLKTTATALRRSNEELEQFAYVASHDLQEPLRMVASFLQLLEQRYRGKLDENAQQFIDFAVDGARRMQTLINDLLAYSCVGTRAKPLERVDFNLIFDEAKRNLMAVITRRAADVTSDPLPTVHGDRVQLVQLLQNLIGNGIKFNDGKWPKVHVKAARRGQDWIIAVSDNGIGIDPQYADRIFVIFKRLHAGSQYPGTGIGLAICKRIAERHQGRIWFESPPGDGAMFCVSIPDRTHAEEAEQ